MQLQFDPSYLSEKQLRVMYRAGVAQLAASLAMLREASKGDAYPSKVDFDNAQAALGQLRVMAMSAGEIAAREAKTTEAAELADGVPL